MSARTPSDGAVARQLAHAITDLAESGAGDQTIMDIACRVYKRMLRHYSHIRMEAKRSALESIVKKQANGEAGQTKDSRSADEAKSVGCPHRAYGFRNARGEESELKVDCPESLEIAQSAEGSYPQKSPQSVNSKGHRWMVRSRKPKKNNWLLR